MVEATTTPDSDEVRLAQLACVKLAGLVQGALSIGLPALVTRAPEPRSFLQDRFRVASAFALVLHTVGGPVGNVSEMLHLREQSRKLLSLLEDLHRHLLAALDSPGPLLAHLQVARQTALAFFDAAGDYATHIRLDDAPILRARTTTKEMFDAMENFDSAPASFAG